MKLGFICCQFLILISCASVPDLDQASTNQVAYVASLHSFQYVEEERVKEVPGTDEIIVSNGCGEVEVELHVLASSENISEKQRIHENLGEWCQTPFDWRPVREWLVIADFPSMKLRRAYPVENEIAIVDSRFQEDELIIDAMKSLLQEEDLDRHIPYPFTVNLALPSKRLAFEKSSYVRIIDDDLFVVKGISLKKVFGDY
ncbi:MAG: hypothetical protein HKO02_04605 [Hyphomonadaceae bacterium]|nr:hypothetical protein [Hyphomonadaceae bacterium]